MKKIPQRTKMRGSETFLCKKTLATCFLNLKFVRVLQMTSDIFRVYGKGISHRLLITEQGLTVHYALGIQR